MLLRISGLVYFFGMRKRVLIDARMVGPLGHGIALYVRQLAEGLARLETPYEPHYLIAPNCPSDSFLRTQPHQVSKYSFLSLWEIRGLAREIRGYSLFHSTSFASLLNYPCPHAQTVHDLNHLHYGGFGQRQYYKHLLLPSLRKARAVLSVSEAAAIEVRHWMQEHGIDREVRVAPNAIEEFPEGNDDAVLKRFGLKSQEYFFTLTNPKPHKNLEGLERAYRAARAKRALPPLVVSVNGDSAEGVLRTGPLKDPEVGPLLRHAKCIFFPSLYEGFGRPPVEAALAGAIPVVSSLAVHHEALAGVRKRSSSLPRPLLAGKRASCAWRMFRIGFRRRARNGFGKLGRSSAWRKLPTRPTAHVCEESADPSSRRFGQRRHHARARPREAVSDSFPRRRRYLLGAH